LSVAIEQKHYVHIRETKFSMALPLNNRQSTQTRIVFKIGNPQAEPAMRSVTTVVWVMAAVLLLALIFGIFWQFRGDSTAGTAKATAMIQGGEALYAGVEQAAPQQLADGTSILLASGDTLTATTSLIQITYFDGQTTELLPGASITIQQLERRKDATIVEILVNIGRVINRVKRTLREDELFKVNTPSSAAAVRGTEFIVETQSATTSYYAANEGVVRITLDGQSVDLSAGQEVLAVTGQPLMVRQQSGFTTIVNAASAIAGPSADAAGLGANDSVSSQPADQMALETAIDTIGATRAFGEQSTLPIAPVSMQEAQADATKLNGAVSSVDIGQAATASQAADALRSTVASAGQATQLNDNQNSGQPDIGAIQTAIVQQW
jgi:hypothetical protein